MTIDIETDWTKYNFFGILLSRAFKFPIVAFCPCMFIFIIELKLIFIWMVLYEEARFETEAQANSKITHSYFR